MSETKGHDLMCLAQEFGPVVSTRFCDCERVARIRADEVERRFGWVTQEDARAWFLTDLRAEVERMAAQDLGPAATPTQVGYDSGRAGAFADVLALLPEEVDRG